MVKCALIEFFANPRLVKICPPIPAGLVKTPEGAILSKDSKSQVAQAGLKKQQRKITEPKAQLQSCENHLANAKKRQEVLEQMLMDKQQEPESKEESEEESEDDAGWTDNETGIDDHFTEDWDYDRPY